MTTVEVNGQKYQKANPQIKDWQTPPDFFKKLDEEFHFTLDAAASHENALLTEFCTPEGTFQRIGNNAYDILSDLDGLTIDWSGQRVFCNPPYDSSLHSWVEKAAKREAEVAVLLLPPSVDTRWFHEFIWSKRPSVWVPGESEQIVQKDKLQIWFHKGRLAFWHNGKPGLAPRAGNLLAIFRK